MPVDYDGILGNDFIRQARASCNYATKQIIIGETRFKFYPYKQITLKPRSETIVKIVTDINTIGITRKEEKMPEIYIGKCGRILIVHKTDSPPPLTAVDA